VARYKWHRQKWQDINGTGKSETVNNDIGKHCDTIGKIDKMAP